VYKFKYLASIFLASQIFTVQAVEFSGFIGVESLGFLHSPLENTQHQHYFSGVAEFEWYHEWDNGKQSLAFVPFYRYSQHDSRRTHFDIRELTWLKAAQNWEFRLGFRKVFWGVAESQHLVDIINQTDSVENSDTEDKFGQPMLNLAIIQDWGTVDLFILTGFRERSFSGVEGRLRSIPEISLGAAKFEKYGVQKHLAYAIRWAHTLDNLDLGISHFYGTNREPSLIPIISAMGSLQLIPYYEMIHQTGLDLQLTQENWLWKLETMLRSGQGKTFLANTAGLEYTFYNVLDSSIDVGLVTEYLYDSRGNNATSMNEDDILAGIRLAFNDIQSTDILAGILFDRDSQEKLYSIEASRRFGDAWKLQFEARFFSNSKPNDISYFLRQDDHVRFELGYYF